MHDSARKALRAEQVLDSLARVPAAGWGNPRVISERVQLPAPISGADELTWLKQTLRLFLPSSGMTSPRNNA
jgi:hypothetical protein